MIAKKVSQGVEECAVTSEVWLPATLAQRASGWFLGGHAGGMVEGMVSRAPLIDPIHP